MAQKSMLRAEVYARAVRPNQNVKRAEVFFLPKIHFFNTPRSVRAIASRANLPRVQIKPVVISLFRYTSAEQGRRRPMPRFVPQAQAA